MTLYVKGTDVVIVGTLEGLFAMSKISGLSDEGLPIWTGETLVDSDSQYTVMENDQPVWLDEEGIEYRNVTVVDRRDDGVEVEYQKLSTEPMDDLLDYLNMAEGQARYIEENTDDELIKASVDVIARHLANMASGIEKTRQVIKEAVKAHDGYVET